MGILDGRAVVVSGAGRGLDCAYALHVARCGAEMVVNDLDVAAGEGVAGEIRAADGTAAASGHSVADPSAAESRST